MPLTLETHVAALPELGEPGDTVWVLFVVQGQREPTGPTTSAQTLTPRAPLRLALALDASSSMRGARFALALEATRKIVDSLTATDRLVVVTFDRNAQIALQPVDLDDRGRADARAVLDKLTTGLGTNLDAGWREASDALLRGVQPGAALRTLVLTDGYPTRGEQRRDTLRARIAEGRTKGIETSFIGIGEGIDEGLCALLSDAGEGRFHYVRDETSIGDAVAAEVEGARNLAAREVSVKVELTPRVARAEVVQRFVCSPSGPLLDIKLGAVGYDAPRTVLLKVKLEPGSADAMVGVAHAQGKRDAVVSTQGMGPTRPGFGLGKSAGDFLHRGVDRTESVKVMLDRNGGSPEARRSVALEYLTHRTLAEIRSAWNGLDAGRRDAVLRRLDRARTLRTRVIECGLVSADDLASLPDVDLVQAAMLSMGPEASEARRRFTSWEHNTQHSFVGFELPVPTKLRPKN